MLVMATPTDPTQVATTVLGMLREGRFEEFATLFGPALAEAASADTVRVAWTAEIAKIGGVTAVGPTVLEPVDSESVRAKVPVIGDSGELSVRMVIDSAGLLQGFRLAPPEESAWRPPHYAVSRRFTEREVTLTSGS